MSDQQGAPAGQLALPVDPAMARYELRLALTARRWSGDVDAVLLALNEALVNAALHAGGVRRARASIGERAVVIEVWDRGPGFDPLPYVEQMPDAMAERGRGVWLISRVADEWNIRRDRLGTRVTLRFDVADLGSPRSEGTARRPLLAPAP